ncbi:heterogeneous nuclear ribonucleoprotein U-like protein 1 [Eurytemora carolleeae]|uniref:heterogeneous nuclear ribonucleoprotein U-like protein 1 n=1 Tax=Eurytemora carolleeae TaxID=1294199 RepID=UPI000C77410F|nr:heterogeneous nuclear ribonucleoprotein U-like protein 1 [Eurytemora carolleeae]|eukprot:XP_023345250.1 heterogeneous nuclear ribonucleoprotein U-like protein 1 [Eurytemora affinis]
MLDSNLEKMKVADLREELEKRGLDTKGTKPFLIDRLQEALSAENGATGGAETGSADMDMDSNDSEQVQEVEEDEQAEEQQEEAEEQQEEAEEQQEEPEMEDEPATEAVEPAHQNGDQANGVKEEGTEEKPVVPEVKKAAAPEKGVKRKFGETGLSPEELKPWNIREDEPELPDDFVCLDWFNSDLNLRIRHDDFLSAMPLNKESWSWVYAGCRATHGISSGKIFFEVTYLDTMKVWTDKDGFHLDLRVGWSTNAASMQLGENDKSWCYSSAEGKKASNKEFLEYGAKFERGDVVGAYLDMGEEMVTMIFTKNGETQGEAYSFPRAELGGEALFPHILTRNVKFECNFGKKKDGTELAPLKEALEGYTQIAKCEAETLIRGDSGIKTREECHFILMVGLPSVGKTTWAKNYAAAHPEKKFEIINAALYLEKATVNGDSRKNHTTLAWEKVHHRITKALQDVLKIASSRRRNVILDQTNVYVDAQLRKARPFEKMKRMCVVMVPSDEEMAKRRKQQEEEGEMNIPDEACNEMKANIAFPNEDNGVFDEIVFTDLPREEAQAQLEKYNKEAQDAGFGRKHLEYQSQWEHNKRMRGMGPMFGRGGPRGFPRGGGGPFRGPMRGGPPMRGGRGWGGGHRGFAPQGGYGYGGGAWGPYGHQGGYQPRGGAQGYGAYPGNRNWGGWNR